MESFQETSQQISESLGHLLPNIFKQLEAAIDKGEESLLDKVDRIFFEKYSLEQKNRIQELLQSWSDYGLSDLLDFEEVINQSTWHYYKQVEFLSARVYSKVISYIKELRGKPTEQNKTFRPFMADQQLVFSYNRFFWKKRTFRPSGYSYGKFGVKHEDVKQQKDSSDQIKIVSKWIEQCNIPLLKKLHQFMIDIQLITLHDNAQINNTFIKKIQRISKQQQKVLYLKSMEILSFQDIKDLHNKAFKTNNHQFQIKKQLKKSFPNYYFYKGETNQRKKIRTLHMKFEDYRFLENRHDYIQWMFPNHYGSAFNSSSFNLEYIETKLFLDDRTIGLRMLISTYIFFDFMGIRLNLNTLQLTICSQQRLKAVILVNFHNHLRIMRILACLSVIGFREIALKLIKLLDEYTSQGKILSRERNEFEISWQIYGDQTPGVPKKRAKAMCFLEEQTFPQQHCIFKLLKQVQDTIPKQSQVQPECKFLKILQYG